MPVSLIASFSHICSDLCESNRREVTFQLYIEALSKNISLVFSLDHTHYARWIPVHLHNLVSLKECHPTIYAEFEKGNFTVKNLSGHSQLLLLIKPMSRIMHMLKVMMVQ